MEIYNFDEKKPEHLLTVLAWDSNNGRWTLAEWDAQRKKWNDRMEGPFADPDDPEFVVSHWCSLPGNPNDLKG